MIDTPRLGRILFPEGNTMRVYDQPRRVIVAHDLDDVLPALNMLDAEVAAGREVAGFLAYEAAAAFDPALKTHAPATLPLLWFGVYDGHATEPLPRRDSAPTPTPDWRPALSRPRYEAALDRIREHIAAGDTYQVNFTYPLESDFTANPESWFFERLHAQRSPLAAFLDLGTHAIMSLSPELFFSLDGETLTARPMKGTRPRGYGSIDDEALREALAHSPKDRAENLMIVDMIRNDLGRVCAVNSIDVSDLFHTERYPTVWQMTSTVTGRSTAPVPEILAALFPCASVTGAPKVETMKIIRALEEGPRGVYCGAIGWWGPGRRARFNVAIRTAVLERATGHAHYAVGSGITWDSETAREYEECGHKAAILHHTQPDFELLESLRLDENGYLLLEEHLERMAASAKYFDRPFEKWRVEAALRAHQAVGSHHPYKVRLTLDAQGAIHVTRAALPEPSPWKVGLALEPVDSLQPWTHHKTTHRDLYDAARAARPDCTDVILWTADGLLTEATYANIVLRFGDRLVTPALDAGFLPGVYRRHLLETGRLEEGRLTCDDLAIADEIKLINSVRGWIPVEWLDLPRP